MNIEKTQSGSDLVISLDGRLDTTTAPKLEAVLKTSLEGIDKLTLDFSGLSYLSSAGLRVVLTSGCRVYFSMLQSSSSSSTSHSIRSFPGKRTC